MDEDTPDDECTPCCSRRCSRTTRSGGRQRASADTVEAIAPDDIRSLLRALATGPSAMVVAAAGLIDHDQVVAEVEARFGPARATVGRAPQRTPTLPQPAARGADAGRSSRPTSRIGFRGADPHRPRPRGARRAEPCARRRHVEPPVREIREERGLAYAVYSAHTEFYATPARSRSTPAPTPAQVDEVLDLVDAELDQLGTTASPTTSSTSRSGTSTGSLRARPRGHGQPHGAARRIPHGARACAHGRRAARRYRAVTRDDVQRVAQQVLSGPRSLAAVGPIAKRTLSARFSRVAIRHGLAAVRRSSSSSPCSDPAGSACRASRSAGAAARPRSRSTAAP